MRATCLLSVAVAVAALAGAANADVVPAAAVDTATQGDWLGVYGSDGYILFSYDTTSGDRVVLPSYVSGIGVAGASRWIWDNPDPTGDVRALQDPLSPSDRVAACIYSGGGAPTVTIDCLQTDPFRLAVYMVDWDTYDRQELLDINGGGLSGTDTVGDFHAGKWYVYDVDPSAGATVTVAMYAVTGVNAVMSAMAFDPIPEPATLTLLALPAAALIRRRRV